MLVQPHKFLAWLPSSLPLAFSPFVGFLYLLDGIKVLDASFGFVFFISSFLQDALDEDVHHVDVLLKLGDVQIIFGMHISSCFAHIPFIYFVPSPLTNLLALIFFL